MSDKVQPKEQDQKQKPQIFQIYDKFMSKIYPYVKLFALSQAGVLLTYEMTQQLKVSNVLASSTQGLLFASFLTADFDCHFSATFAGMSSAAVFHENLGYACLTAFIHTLLFLACKKIFIGFGGKLGTIAMISCLIGAILPEIVEKNYTYPIHDKDKYQVEDFEENYYLNPIFACIGSVLTQMFKVYSKKVNNNAVIGSSIVGLLAAFFFPMVTDEKTPKLEAIVYVGSFVGMAAPKILGKGFLGYAIAGIFSGFFLQAFNGTFLVGGKYGFSAFLGCNLYYLILLAFNKFFKKNNNINGDKYNQEQKEKQQQEENIVIRSKLETEAGLIQKNPDYCESQKIHDINSPLHNNINFPASPEQNNIMTQQNTPQVLCMQ